MEDIDVWNFRQERFMLRHLRQWSKNFGFGSALSHNSGAANTILFTIQTFNEHSRMAKLSQPYLRGHMRWNVTSLQVQLGLIGTYNFGRLSTLKSNILSTRKLRVLWPILCSVPKLNLARVSEWKIWSQNREWEWKIRRKQAVVFFYNVTAIACTYLHRYPLSLQLR